jgi:hypothetical protein
VSSRLIIYFFYRGSLKNWNIFAVAWMSIAYKKSFSSAFGNVQAAAENSSLVGP